jgi:acyl carrier protein
LPREDERVTEPACTSPEPITLESALAWIAETFNEPVACVQESTSREDLPGWDSLGNLILMAGLDERFNIRLMDLELSNLKSVHDILGILRSNGALATT